MKSLMIIYILVEYPRKGQYFVNAFDLLFCNIRGKF